MSPSSGYEYLDDVTVSDVGFRAWAPDLPELFQNAWTATANVLVSELGSVGRSHTRQFSVEEADLEMLLHSFLEELLYLKDAEGFIGQAAAVSVERSHDGCALSAVVRGEPIDPTRHRLGVDVKAVTMHRLSLRRTSAGYEAVVVLDV